MVLVTRNVTPFHDEKHGFPFEATQTREKVSDMVLQTQLVGLISAISVLSEYANDIFTSILKESTGITHRIAAIGERCVALNQNVTIVEKYNQQTTLDKLNSNARAEFHATNPEEHQHFTAESIPSNIRAQYEKCKPPPNLSLLDTFMEDGQKCLKMYTNPEFFIEQWIAEQKRLQEEAKQKRRERREARLKRRAEKGAGDTGAGKKVVTKIRKMRYDPVTGEKIYYDESAPTTSSPSQTNVDYVPGRASTFSSNSTPSSFFEPLPQLQSPASGTLGTPPPPPTYSHAPTPPTPHYNNYSPQQQNYSPALTHSYSQSSGLHMPSPTAGVPPPPPPSAPPPPPPPSAPAPPPPPKAGLASSIANVQLNKTEPQTKLKVVDTRSDLLSSIKEGITLKSVKDAPSTAAPKQDAVGASVANILARRIAWAPSDSEDDDDSDSEEWD